MPGKRGFGDPLKNKINLLGLREYFVFLPFVEDIKEIYLISDVVLQPSIYPESFGLVALEAMSFGIPVIATNNGGMSDFIIDGENGILIPPLDADALVGALEKILFDSDCFNEISQAAKVTVKNNFSFDDFYNQVVTAYDI